MSVGQTATVLRRANGSILNFPYGEVSKTGLTLRGNMSIEEWMECGEALKGINGSIQWWLGDWLNFGERKYGEKYSQALETTDYAYDTLAQAASVAGRVESCRRRQNLSWSHHQEVAAFEPPIQDAWLNQAEKHNWTRKQLREAITAHRNTQPVTELPAGTYRVIYADPPWKYNDQRTGTKEAGAAIAHYPLMELEAICGMRDDKGKHVSEIAGEDAVCFLWGTSPLLPEALKVLEAWGFEYKASFIWDKKRGYNGHYNDVRHEILLIGVRGSCVPDREALHDSIQAIEKTKHSRKPHEFYELIESMYTRGPYLELFARNKRDGWESWGNQV